MKLAPARRACGHGFLAAAALLALAAHAAPCLAQATAPPPLRVARRGVARAIAGDTVAGGIAYPAAALEALGARLQAVPGGVRVILFRDTLRFTVFSPFFRDGKRIAQLPFMVVRRGDDVYWPRALFVSWLPARFDHGLSLRRGVLVRSGARATDIARAARAAPSSAVLASAAPAVASPAPSAASSAAGGAPSAGTTRAAAGRASTSGGKSASGPRADAVSDSSSVRSRNAHRLVVLDPGHGGRDPGRIGPDGVEEKNVTLAIAKKLAVVLRKQGYVVRLTRTRDTLISLADRPRMANRWKRHYPEALFMSIHANGYTGHAEGFETYFLSEARTEDERRVAAMENSAESYETHPSPGPGESDVSKILNNLKNNFYVHASDALAEDVQNSLRRVEPGPDRGVKQAGFRVLVGALMPAVLVETAFLSDPKEERLLASSKFQEKLAHALAAAINTFFNSHEHLWQAAGRQ